MSDEWITRTEWEMMLRRSDALHAYAKELEWAGLPSDEVWAEIKPLSERIRSPSLKVRGIDDRLKETPA